MVYMTVGEISKKLEINIFQVTKDHLLGQFYFKGNQIN